MRAEIGERPNPVDIRLLVAVMLEDAVYEAVRHGFLRRHRVISFRVLIYRLERLPGVLREDLGNHLAAALHALRGDGDFRLLTADPSDERLVDEDLGVGEAEALPLRAGRQDEGTHRCRETGAYGADVGADVVHDVDECHAGLHVATGGVHVERDVLRRVDALEVEQLGDGVIHRQLIDLAGDEDDTGIEQARIDIELAFAVARLLDDGRDIS